MKMSRREVLSGMGCLTLGTTTNLASSLKSTQGKMECMACHAFHTK
ncbi:MAG: hypothetical protein KAT90_15705 [Gammaproteobacteria bacterium]|nr:hypothetical protein [Gammaproteobacteria bacterium]